MTIPVENINNDDNDDHEPSDGVFVNSMKTITLKDDRGFLYGGWQTLESAEERERR